MPYPTILWFLAALFMLRVLGQFLVAAFQLPFLPPMSAWYSGLILYPILLPLLIGILILQVKIGRDVGRNPASSARENIALDTGCKNSS